MVIASALLGAGCERRADLGSIGDGAASLLWTATFEPDNLSEWTSDGEGGTYTENVGTKPSVTSSVVHAGSYAGVVEIAPIASMASTSYFFRNQPTPLQGYYSAWFYIPSTIVIGSWLSLTHFSGSETGDGNNLVGIWDVNLYATPSGGTAAQLYDYMDQVNQRQPTPVPFPRDAWVQLEVYLEKATGPTGAVTVWQDGTQILQRTDVQTVPTEWLQWDAGGASDDISPTPATIYLDDAAISLTRLGPGS